MKDAIEQAQLLDPRAPIQNTQFAQMVWEALRFHPINPFVVRYVEKDQELSGVKLKEGSRLLVATHSAMMDPRSVKFPQQFMAKRPYEDRRMNLGIFQHRCLGDYVAEVMIPTVLYQMLLSPDIQRDQTATGRIGLNQNIDFGPRNSFPEKYVVTTSISPPPPSRIDRDSFPIPFSSASSLNSGGPGRLADLSLLYERNDIMGFNDQRSNLNSDYSSFPTRNRNPMEIIVSGELKFFRYLSARDRVDDLIEDEDGFDEKKKNLKFRLCIVGISLANLDTDYFERENSYSFCARWAGIKTRLVPADIEQVYDRFPMDQLLSQVLDEQGQPRPALVSLCMKNPLGKKTFLLPAQSASSHRKHDEVENNYYCQLNLGFRACNLLVQKINPGISRDEAFQRCTEERRTRFPLSDTEKREYRQHLPHYLATDSP